MWFLVVVALVAGNLRTFSVPVADEAECKRLGEIQLLAGHVKEYSCEKRGG